MTSAFFIWGEGVVPPPKSGGTHLRPKTARFWAPSPHQCLFGTFLVIMLVAVERGHSVSPICTASANKLPVFHFQSTKVGEVSTFVGICRFPRGFYKILILADFIAFSFSKLLDDEVTIRSISYFSNFQFLSHFQESKLI